MVMNTDDLIIGWTKPASDSEEHRCDSTISSIQNCINSFDFGVLKKPHIQLRGSYLNNTNVKHDSDVDMYALFSNYFYHYNVTGIVPATNVGPTYRQLKSILATCLINKFGNDSVTIGNKSIKIKSNSYRVDADVVPVVNLTFYGNPNMGVSFYSENNKFIMNFPKQDYDNGCAKNTATNHQYKYYVRVFKRFRNMFTNQGIIRYKIPSYVIESLLYNIPNVLFLNNTPSRVVLRIVEYLKVTIDSSIFYEVNGIKQMFNPQEYHEQQTSRTEIKYFITAIENYLMKEIAA